MLGYAIDASSFVLERISGEDLLGYMQNDTWHHVSKPGNRVNFYDIDILPLGEGWIVG